MKISKSVYVEMYEGNAILDTLLNTVEVIINMIKREINLSRKRNFYHLNLIKVLYSVRKSELLK